MTWRERLRTSPSYAETAVLIELQRRKLATHLMTQVPFEFDPVADQVHGTVVDLFWTHQQYAVFLNGGLHEHGFPKLHLRQRQEHRDTRVTAALERRGVTVHRFPYTPPLRKRRLHEICDHIQHHLTEDTPCQT